MIPILDEVIDDILLNDHSPSSVVESANFDPVLGVVRVTFTAERGGQTYSFPCSLEMWGQYKNADSKGSTLASILGVHGGRR